MKIEIEVKFKIGSIVYLRTDPDQFERVVVSYVVQPNLQILYIISIAESTSTHYALELSAEKSISFM